MTSVRMRSCVLTLLLLLGSHAAVSSLRFHIGDAETKCFMADLPDDTSLVGNFHIQRDGNLSSNQDLGIFVEATDPGDKLILSRSFGSEAKFRFMSRVPGKHQICLRPLQRPLSAGGVLTVHLDMRVGEATKDYAKMAADERLTELQLRVRRLSQQVEQILKEQDYYRLKDKQYREVDHNTNMWIFWWPVARSLYMVALVLFYTNTW